MLSLQSAVVSTFNGNISLTTVYETTITEIDEQITVLPTKRSLPKSNVVSLQTSVLVIKEFTCTYTCIDCRKKIEPGPFKDSAVIICQTCSTTFLKEGAMLTNTCMVLLNNKQWYKANTAVSYTLCFFN